MGGLSGQVEGRRLNRVLAQIDVARAPGITDILVDKVYDKIMDNISVS
jgi:hypothetical protein